MTSIQSMYDKYPQLTKKQKSISDYIMNNPEDICYISLKELSLRTASSEVSVLRLCHALGFESYVQLKEMFREHTQQIVKNLSQPEFLSGHASASPDEDREQLLSQICAADYANMADMASRLSSAEVFDCARRLLAANEVVVFGHDGSKSMADYLTHRLNFLRIKATSIKLGDNDTVQRTLARLRSNDIIIIFSFPPYHLPAANIVRFGALRGASVITITDSKNSPAVIEGGITFVCKTAARFFFNSQTAPISLINTLTSCMAVEMGEKLDKILAEEQEVGYIINSGFPSDLA